MQSIVAALMIVLPVAKPVDEVCARLDVLERAVLSAPAPSPSNVDIFWGTDRTAISSVECAHYGSNPASQFCQWLLKNMSYEYPGSTAMRIANCAKFSHNPFNTNKFPGRRLRKVRADGSRLSLRSGQTSGKLKLPWLRLTIEKVAK